MITSDFKCFPGVSDLIKGLRFFHSALYLAWSDTLARYRRSVLGPFWLTLGTAIGVVGLGWLWSSLLKIDRASFIPSLTAGLIIWQLLASCITEGTGIFVRQSSLIRNLQLPYSIHPLQLLFRHLINFAHNLLIYVIVALIFSVPISWPTLLVIPGMLLVSLNLLWMMLLLAMLGARFRDLEFAVASLIPLLFFVSPVLYRPGYLSGSAGVIWANPVSYLIEVLREPLLGNTPSGFAYIIVTGLLVLGWLFTLRLFNTRYNRIAFWV